jgi:hypothetical protein
MSKLDNSDHDETEIIMSLVAYSKGRYSPDDLFDITEMILEYRRLAKKEQTDLKVVSMTEDTH